MREKLQQKIYDVTRFSIFPQKITTGITNIDTMKNKAYNSLMDYMPPPTEYSEHISPAAQSESVPKANLIIRVDEASYDQNNNQAVIKLSEAFEKARIIQAYNGENITLTYTDEKINLEQCPAINVPITDIKRDIQFLDNTVTLTISNIDKELAEKIRDALCLLIDTDTVQKITNPNPIPSDGADPRRPYAHHNR
ncbi:MAG: hypothetical protein ACRBCK_07865 [Alphaproteobacteria bacterium]